MTLDEAISLARFIVDSDKEIGDAIGLPIGDDLHLARAVLHLAAEVEELNAALLDSPAAAEVMRQLPNAMRLYTAERDALRAEVERLSKDLHICWTCPDCAFTFAAYHTNQDGSLTCPVCEVEMLTKQRDEANKMADRAAKVMP